MSYKGGYAALAFYQQTEIIHDFTVEFCQRYIDKFYKNYNDYKNKNYKSYKYYSRQSDQMIQAARSGKQNIAEGYLQKSLKGRIKLVGVARASLEELLKDYEDFLRQNNLRLWAKDSAKARAIRALAYKNYKNYNDYKHYLAAPSGAANAMVCLINQTNALLDSKLRWLEKEFIEKGGYTENLFRKRLARRTRL